MRKEGPAGATPAPNDPAVPGAAGGPRGLAETRCGFAEKARVEAAAAAGRLAEAKHIYEVQAAAALTDQMAIDPAATQASKDDAHRFFRASVAGARTRGQVEAAAIAWLAAINEINSDGRIARARVAREHKTIEALLAEVARLAEISEASAAMAALATQACQAARAALAAEAEAAADAAEAAGAPMPSGAKKRTGARAAPKGPEASVAVPPAVVQAAPVPSWTGATLAAGANQAGLPSELPPDENRSPTDWLVIDIRSPEPQVVIRLMRRDGRILGALVDRLAGADPAARRHWQLLLSNFVDSVAAAAIDDGCLEFPADNPFWRQFTTAESRETARGLAALGFRFDGFSAFVDGRVPGQRDLALAVSSTGLLPARVRHWPRPDEAAELFNGVRASTDAFIAARAPALTLGELVRLLGHRAELLADLWNEWPAIRPLLFSTSL